MPRGEQRRDARRVTGVCRPEGMEGQEGQWGNTTEGVEAQSAQGTEQAVCLTFRESFTQEIPRQQT